MSVLSVVTWAAVAVLVVGSPIVFVWFLFDVGKILHGPAAGPVGEERER